MPRVKGGILIKAQGAQEKQRAEQDWESEQFSYFEVTETAAETIPCSIDQVDTAQGVKNAGGKISRYVEVLRLFCIETNTLATNMPAYYSHNGEMFRIKLHGLKNSCNCIGALSYADTAKDIERGYVMGIDISDDIQRFSFDLFSLIDRIADYIDSVRLMSLASRNDTEKEMSPIQGIPREDAAELRESMQNLETEDVLKKLAVIRKKQYSNDIEMYMDRIVELVNRYDFEAAIEMLAKVTEEI